MVAVFLVQCKLIRLLHETALVVVKHVSLDLLAVNRQTNCSSLGLVAWLVFTPLLKIPVVRHIFMLRFCLFLRLVLRNNGPCLRIRVISIDRLVTCLVVKRSISKDKIRLWRPIWRIQESAVVIWILFLSELIYDRFVVTDVLSCLLCLPIRFDLCRLGIILRVLKGLILLSNFEFTLFGGFRRFFCEVRSDRSCSKPLNWHFALLESCFCMRVCLLLHDISEGELVWLL